MILNAPEGFRTVNEKELLRAEVKKDLAGLYLELETPPGSPS